MQIIRATSPTGLAAFVDLPFAIHKDNPLWAPPISKQLVELLSPDQHPFWRSARRELFLAIRNGRPVGRIAAIIDNAYNAFAREDCGAFGFFECDNDQEAAGALLNAAGNWLGQQGMKFMRGPLNPSTNYTCGMLVQGFELAPALMMPWNPSYYPGLIEREGLRKEQDLFAYVIDNDNLALSDRLKTEIAAIRGNSDFTCRPSSKKTLKADIRALLDIYQKAWANNWGFTPLSPAEAEQHVCELGGVLDPDFFVLFFKDRQPVAGMLALPDLTPLLQRLQGRISLAAPWHFWRSRKQVRQGLRIMLFGILPEYRLHGLPTLLLDYMLKQARKKPDLKWVEGSWILEDNLPMNEIMDDFSAILAKRYRIYRRELGPC